MTSQSSKLSPIQLHLLRFFSEREVSEEETKELQLLIARHYADKADELMEEIWQKKKLGEEKMLEILNTDFQK